MRIKSIIKKLLHSMNEIKNEYDLSKYLDNRRALSRIKKTRGHAAFLVLSPAHGNLGDHAIAYAEVVFFNSIGRTVFEVTDDQLFFIQKHRKLDIFNGSDIFVSGGGFLGSLWPQNEGVVLDVIRENPDSNIVILPNTVVYNESEEGKAEFQKAANIYRAHKYLSMYAREKKSFEIMKSLYDNVGLMPDFAMYLNKVNSGISKSGCLVCLRNDREKTITEVETARIYDWIKGIYGENYESIDTVLEFHVSLSERENQLELMWHRFQSAELVITDRLHGMIFAAITGTPCIVVKSKSHKIEGCYEWLKDNGYIKLCDNIDRLSESYELLDKNNINYNNMNIMDRFSELERVLEKI